MTTLPFQPSTTLQFPSMVGVIEPGKLGAISIEHFYVSKSESDLTHLRSVIKRDPDIYVPEGRYVRLYLGGTLIMSDTPMEMKSNMIALQSIAEHGAETVIVGGLGIGMVTLGIASMPSVKRVIVIEMNDDVIKLVGPAIQALSNKIEIVHADVFDWRPEKGTKFDYAYFDIWPYITEDNKKDFKKLRRVFGRYVKDRRIDCWMEGAL